MAVQIKVNYKSIDDFNNASKGLLLKSAIVLQNAVKVSTALLYSRAVQETPVRTGFLQKHQIFFSQGGLRSIIRPRVKYGIYVHEGTGVYGPKGMPIIIRPKNKAVLKFKIGNRNVFAKQVINPGQRPNPFYQRAVDNTKSQVDAEFDKASANIINILKGSNG